MIDLPFGLADPLHIDPPFPWWAVLAEIALLLTWWLYRRWRAGRTSEPAPKSPQGRAQFKGIRAHIEELRRRHRKTKSYRAGCHELAELLRRYCQEQLQRPYTRLTAREMARRFGDNPLSRFFGLIADLQFSRSEPKRGDFEGACDLAQEVTFKNKRGRLDG